MGDSLNELLNDYSPEIQDLSLKLRRLLLSVVPDAQKRVYLGWRSVGYGCSPAMEQQFCAIGPYQSRVNLYFRRGADSKTANASYRARERRRVT